jgi:hypothetical protein
VNYILLSFQAVTSTSYTILPSCNKGISALALSVESYTMSSAEPIATILVESVNGKPTAQPSEIFANESDRRIILVDFEENDPENPLNWSLVHKWLIVFAISWMGFVR